MNLRASESLSNIDQFLKKSPEFGVELPEPIYIWDCPILEFNRSVRTRVSALR
jgi:hypothetical protein